jgi:peptide/nickel transport system permease protein
MRSYILQRLILMLPVLLLAASLCFLIVRILPGNVAYYILGDQATVESAARLAALLGIDRPLWEQYLDFLGHLAHLDFGDSLVSKQPIIDELKRRFPVTVELAILTGFLSLAIGIPAGLISAVKQNRPHDYMIRVTSAGGLSIPTFWTGLLFVLLPVIFFRWAPNTRFVPFFDDPFRNLQQFIFPAVALALAEAAVLARLTRSMMLEVLRSDYMRTAQSKGLSSRTVVLRHGLRNALIPIITLFGAQLGRLMGGTVILEQIYSIPGMGQYFIRAIQSRDYPVVESLIIVYAVVFLMVNLLVDLLYAALDPRIRLS